MEETERKKAQCYDQYDGSCPEGGLGEVEFTPTRRLRGHILALRGLLKKNNLLEVTAALSSMDLPDFNFYRAEYNSVECLTPDLVVRPKEFLFRFSTDFGNEIVHVESTRIDISGALRTWEWASKKQVDKLTS